MNKNKTSQASNFDYDAIVIGTGVAGIYQLYRLQERGLRVLALEAGSDVGGVWWWNRYPGARLDSESYSYAYSFSPELLAEWNWSEHFASQSEMQRYFTFVVDRLDLRKNIKFESLVTSARYDAVNGGWAISTQAGDSFTARYVIAAIGPLTSPTFPRIQGRDSFKGDSYHTSRWPHEPVDFAGKRVGVIGTGATGVQVVQEVAKTAAELVVFQRTPNYCAPLRNEPIKPEQQAELKRSYASIIKRCRSTNSWFIHDADPRSVFDLSDEDREAFLEALYNERGIGIWKANFRDIGTDAKANDIVSEFMRRKIRERVRDPQVAAMLSPQTYGFGNRRVPLESGYYEVFNQSNVTLVDLKQTPIERITPHAIVTGETEFELDIIVYATGFDAVTGSFDRIAIEGVDGVMLKDKWVDGPASFLGVHTSGFPNFFMPGGPLASVGNFTPALEYSVDWIMDLLDYMDSQNVSVIDALPEAEAEWTSGVRGEQEKLLMSDVPSWTTGVNTNIDGKENTRVIMYVGSAMTYRDRCDTEKRDGYPNLSFGNAQQEQSETAQTNEVGEKDDASRQSA